MAFSHWLLIGFCLSVAACGPGEAHRTYPGPAKTRAEVALLTMEPGVRVVAVDGIQLPVGMWGNPVEVLPGPHSISVDLEEGRSIGGREVRGVLSADTSLAASAGRTYRIGAEISFVSWKPTISETDG